MQARGRRILEALRISSLLLCIIFAVYLFVVGWTTEDQTEALANTLALFLSIMIIAALVGADPAIIADIDRAQQAADCKERRSRFKQRQQPYQRRSGWRRL